MKIKTYFIAVLLGTILFSCNKQSGSQNFDYGKYENGTYSNSFFNLKFNVPTDWFVLSQEQNAGLMNNSEEFVAEENKTLQQAVETSKITTVILFTGSQYGLDASDSIFNPNIMLLAENIKGTDKVKTASDYLLITRNALQQDPTPKEYPFKSFQLKNINGTEFSQMRVISKVSDNSSFTQDYYVKLQNDFALTFILTYNSELQKIALEQALNTLTFSEKK